jgi:hypothetical protein
LGKTVSAEFQVLMRLPYVRFVQSIAGFKTKKCLRYINSHITGLI